MQTVILGADGKLGSILRRGALRHGLDWRMQSRSGQHNFTDPFDPSLYEKGATIINMIGHTGPDQNLLREANVDVVDQLLRRAQVAGVAHVILMSSAAVYGAAGPAPLPETTPTAPLTPYADSKVAMERLAHDRSRHSNATRISILRVGNVAGSDALVTHAHRHAREGMPMLLHRFADGAVPWRSYIGPLDFFHAVHTITQQPPDTLRMLNVAHPQAVPLDAMLLGYRNHLLPTLKWVDAPAPKGIPPRVVLDTSTLEALQPFPHHSDPADAFVAQITRDVP